MLCAVNRQADPLTIVSVAAKTDQGFPIRCSDIERVAPLYDTIRRIVEKSNYNGFGVANVKLAPRRMTSDQLNAYLESIPNVNIDSTDVVTMDFSGAKSSLVDPSEYDAVLKFFEINPRVGGPLLGQWQAGKLMMIESYIAKAEEESG